MATDTAYLMEDALTFFAHRTVSNETLDTNPKATVFGYARFYNSAGDYIEITPMRNYPLATSLIFDDTGGTQADPVFVTVTQDYKDLTLTTMVPRFNKMFDVSASTWTYATSPFVVTDYELFNQGGVKIAEAADTTIGFTVTKGTRYLMKFIIRFFNDKVEQTPDENTRCLVTTEGLKVVQRRMVHNNSPQDLGRPPLFLGVGGEGAYYIANASDGRWKYDASVSSYTAIASGALFPATAVADDAFVLCRQGSDPDQIEGVEFTLSVNGDLASGSSLVWEYYNTASTWTMLDGVTDDTENLSDDGFVRWNVPTDVLSTAELVAGTIGYYYRCRLVGGGWTTLPQIAAVAGAAPLVLRTVSSETDLQYPFNRSLADTIGRPYVGSACKVSAEFGTGSMPVQTRKDDGTLLAQSFEPVRELGIFTATGIVTDEAVAIGEYTGTVSNNLIDIPNTNPRPLKLISAIDTSGKYHNVTDRLVTYVVNGANWRTTVPLANGTFTLTYVGSRITPTDPTVKNIVSVTGTSQELRGPNEVWLYASPNNPADSDSGTDTNLTPMMIQRYGSPMRYSYDGTGTLSPSLTNDGSSALVSATDFDMGQQTNYQLSRVGHGLAEAFNLTKNLGKPANRLTVTLSAGYPMVLCTFDLSTTKQLVNPILVVSASRKTFDKDQVCYKVLIWAEGDPAADTAHERETGWKLAATSVSAKGDTGAPLNTTLQLDMRYDEATNQSPYVDGEGKMYLLVVAADKTFKDGKFTTNPRVHWWDIFHIAKTAQSKARKSARENIGDLAVNYVGLMTSAAESGSQGKFAFRRGIDYLYYPNWPYATWNMGQDGTVLRGLTTTGDEPEAYAVSTRDGSTYAPVLPTARLGMDEEKYIFGATPADATLTLYVQHRPKDIASVYVALTRSDANHDTRNGDIVVNYVGWLDAGYWNEVDKTYSDDHGAATGGTGAGVINITCDTQWWGANTNCDVVVRYLYFDDPDVRVSYLVPDGLMFARAECSQLSHNPPLQPTQGDRMRIYFETQYEKKRVA